MKIAEIKELLKANLLCGEGFDDVEVEQAFAADMMSDVLAFVNEGTVLLTGLVNAHVIRTAEMLDLRCIVFVRGKEIPGEILDLACKQGIVILSTEKTLYVTCGLLFAAGLPGVFRM